MFYSVRPVCWDRRTPTPPVGIVCFLICVYPTRRPIDFSTIKNSESSKLTTRPQRSLTRQGDSTPELHSPPRAFPRCFFPIFSLFLLLHQHFLTPISWISLTSPSHQQKPRLPRSVAACWHFGHNTRQVRPLHPKAVAIQAQPTQSGLH